MTILGYKPYRVEITLTLFEPTESKVKQLSLTKHSLLHALISHKFGTRKTPPKSQKRTGRDISVQSLKNVNKNEQWTIIIGEVFLVPPKQIVQMEAKLPTI